MKTMVLILLLLLAFLQYRLWFGHGSLSEVRDLQQIQATLEQENRELKERNEALAAEVMDLKHGSEALEERARSEMGMIKSDETFYQIIDQDVPEPTLKIELLPEELPETTTGSEP